MKLTLLILGFLSLTACSSLITRTDLKSCQTMCKEKGSCMSHLSKQDGQLNCECEMTKAEKEAIDKEVQELSDEMDKMESEAAKQATVPASEQEIVPAAAESVVPVEVPVIEEQKSEMIAPIKTQVPTIEEVIKVEELKAAPVAEPTPAVAEPVIQEQK